MVSQFTNGYGGENRGKFLKESSDIDKIIESIFLPIYIQPFTNDSNSKNNDS